jgi:asparagine synthase (glutamine-hydrolysing)
MCGISGVIATVADGGVPAGVRLMTEALAHRGPDDHGYLWWSDGADVRTSRSLGDEPVRVGFGHRRLAIIDTSTAGWQPMRSACGRFHLVFNGEVVNYTELRQELVALGHRFETRTDTEVLLAAWQQWGEAALPRLVGMFAFALLDSATRRMVLARDPFGIKPLYYMSRLGRTVFASEIAPLLRLPWARRHADAQSVFDYLRFGIPRDPEATFFADVRAVPAAHLLEFSLDTPDAPLANRRYWAPAIRLETDITFDEAAAHLRTLLGDSVRLHLRSDVPVGAALSGGIDSSAILMLLQREAAAGASVEAFGYTAGGPLDETRWIELVAERAGVPLHKVTADGEALAGSLDRLLTIQGEPFGSTSVFAQYCVFEAAKRAGVRVMLGGQGADEIFGGYRPYLAVRLATLLRGGRVADAARFWAKVRQMPGVDRVLLRTAGELLPAQVHGVARQAIGEPGWPDYFNRGWFERAGVRTAPPVAPVLSASRMKDRLVDAMQASVLPALLRYEDRNAMAFSIENRVPFLTTAIAEFALSLPDGYLIDGAGRSKAVLRAALRGIVPDAVLDRTDKVAFATPEANWLEHSAAWVEETLASPAARAVIPLHADRLRAKWGDWRGARTPGGGAGAHHLLWRGISLIRWAELAGAEFAA